MHCSGVVPILALWQGNSLQEDNMAARRATSQTLKSIGGATMLALGLVILFANLDGLAASLCSFAGVSGHEAVGTLPALGLTILHAAEAYTFNHDVFVSCFRQTLVSFWPLMLVAIGAALFRSAFGGGFARSQAPATSSSEEAR
jgi:hypothetical protein